MDKYVLTIATGKKLYVDMACNLAMSFLYWHPKSDITFQLATDQSSLVPLFLKNKIQIIPIKPGELGEGFSPKLHLDKLVSDGQTLFVDSDCLIFENLDLVFEKFKGRDISVIGTYIANGEWFGEIKKICKLFNVPHIPKFNGGVYYLEKGPIASKVYEKARELEKKYDEIGFVRLRNKPNDEVLMALAMQLFNQIPIADDGTILGDPLACPGDSFLDIIKGERWLTNPAAPNPLHQSWYPFTKVSPLIVHFLGSYTQMYPYKKEVYRLNKGIRNRLNIIVEINAILIIQYPAQVKEFLKKTLRPFYHLIFGVRKVKQSNRISLWI